MAAYDSLTGLAEALRRAAVAHGKHEEEIGQAEANTALTGATYEIDGSQQLIPTSSG